MRVNLLCLLGASMGILSIFLNWRTFVVEEPPGTAVSIHYETLSSIFAHATPAPPDFLLPALLFIACTFLSLLTPLAGLIQLPAAMLVYSSMIIQVNLFGHPPYSYHYYPEVGLLIALVSSVIVIASLFAPVGTGLRIGISDFRCRIRAFQTNAAKDGRRRLDVNIICLVGGLIGLLSLAFPWVSALSMPNPGIQTPIDMVQGTVFVAVAGFIIGAFASIITPLAVSLQIAGSILVVSSMNAFLASPFHQWDIGAFLPGFYVGLISIAVIIVGIIFPAWIGHKAVRPPNRGWIFDRISTISVKPSQ